MRGSCSRERRARARSSAVARRGSSRRLADLANHVGGLVLRLVIGARQHWRFASRPGALRPVAPRPGGAGAARRRRACRSARFSDLSAEARRLRGRRRSRRRRRCAFGQPAGLRQPERAALDAVGHVDGDGDPRRRRDGLGRPRRRGRAAAVAGGPGGVHRALGVLDRLGAARGGLVRAPRSGRLAGIGPIDRPELRADERSCGGCRPMRSFDSPRWRHRDE